MFMRKIVIALIISVLFSSVNACEICGCGVGNYYIGILPHFTHRFIGLRYQFNSFRTRLNNDPSQFSRDFYQTVELWSGWNIGKKVQLLIFVPFNFNHQVSDEGVSNVNGLGDIALLVNYKLFDQIGINSSQQLYVGGGVKLPTGKFEIEEGNPDVAAIANNQGGSGSTDFILNASHIAHIRQWGISTNINYKINTNNKDEYKFGNKLSASSFVYYSVPASGTTISPNIGILYSHTEASDLNNAKVNLTGGTILQCSAGAEISFKKMTVGMNAQLPVTQNFADGQTKSKIKGMVHITFSI
jgi:hypothetical protein